MTWKALGEAVAKDMFLARQLTIGPIRQPGVEAHMTAVRRRCLMAGGGPVGLLTHLALQCFINEFAWRETPEETERVAALQAKGQWLPDELSLLACYRPVTDVAAQWPEVLSELRTKVVSEVREERRLRDEIKALTPIRSGLSEAVREMYEANPYPRWMVMGEASGRPPVQMDAPEVLVAGCGTGKHAILTAKRYNDGRVLAVDLSLSSLAFAQRMARVMGADNLTFGHADILELPTLGRSFDVIEAVGSLQCMEDPAEGLSVLESLLNPGGLIVLGLYSVIARKPLAAAMSLGENFGRTQEDIRAFRAAVSDASTNDPVRQALEFGDFYSTSTCRDLLLHVKEHQHTLPQIADMLSTAGLEFRGLNVPVSIMGQFRSLFPDDPEGLSLQNWHAFEQANPSTFRRMYHVWAQKPA